MQKFDRVSHFMSATRGNVRGKVAVSQIKVDGDLSARLSRVAGRSRKRHHCQRHPNHRWQVVWAQTWLLVDEQRHDHFLS
jgi:hypothetical protein